MNCSMDPTTRLGLQARVHPDKVTSIEFGHVARAPIRPSRSTSFKDGQEGELLCESV